MGKYVGCTAVPAPAMLGCQSGFQTRAKVVNPDESRMHCAIHRNLLAVKTPSRAQNRISRSCNLGQFNQKQSFEHKDAASHVSRT